MKAIKYISIALLIAGFSFSAQAQVVKKKKANETEKAASEQITERMQSLFEEKKTSDANLQWQRVIYRSLDLNKEENMPLYYPEEPCSDGMNLFYIIIKHLSDNTLAAYEYLDGREMFTEEYRINVGDMFDRFHILYTHAKGSSTKAPKYTVENSDVPANEVLSYYILEKYEFNRLNSKVTRKVDAICPVLHRSGDFGGEAIKYPMFWVKMSDLRPFITQQYVFTDNDNNLLKTSLYDYFVSNMYKGDIYKFRNMRNLSMIQMYPDSTKLKHAQDSIEKRLASFDSNIWVPSREELQARREAEAARLDSINALKEGKEAVNPKTKNEPKKSTSSVRSSRSTRGTSSATTSATKPKSSKQSTSKSKATKPKSSVSKAPASNAARSVRRTK